MIAAPQLVASVPAPQPSAELPQAAGPKPQTPAVSSKRIPPRSLALAARAKKEAVAAAEPEMRSLFRRKRGQVERVAFGNKSTGLAALVDRAFRGF